MPAPQAMQRYGKILALALPIMVAMASQSLLNVVDTYLVGSLGAQSLAAVGVGGYLNFIAVSLLLGLGTAVQALVARAHGAGHLARRATPMAAALVIGLIATPPIILLFYYLSDPVLAWISQDAAVHAEARPYFLMRLAGLFAVAMNFSFRGYWNGIHRPGIYLRFLIIAHVTNVLLSYGFIHGRWGLPALGSLGAALGTTLALCLAMLLNSAFIWRHVQSQADTASSPTKPIYQAVTRIAIPTSLQQLSFALGMTMMFWLIAHYGTDYLAVSHVLVSLTLLLILPALAFGLSATSLVGDAIGKADAESAYRWCWDVSHVSLLLVILVASPLWLVPESILALFLHDAELVRMGELPLRLIAIAVCFDGIAIVFAHALLTSGGAKKVFFASFFAQWLFFLPLAYIGHQYFSLSFVGLWWLHCSQRLLHMSLLMLLWRRQRHQLIRQCKTY